MNESISKQWRDEQLRVFFFFETKENKWRNEESFQRKIPESKMKNKICSSRISFSARRVSIEFGFFVISVIDRVIETDVEIGFVLAKSFLFISTRIFRKVSLFHSENRARRLKSVESSLIAAEKIIRNSLEYLRSNVSCSIYNLSLIFVNSVQWIFDG